MSLKAPKTGRSLIVNELCFICTQISFGYAAILLVAVTLGSSRFTKQPLQKYP